MYKHDTPNSATDTVRSYNLRLKNGELVECKLEDIKLLLPPMIYNSFASCADEDVTDDAPTELCFDMCQDKADLERTIAFGRSLNHYEKVASFADEYINKRMMERIAKQAEQEERLKDRTVRLNTLYDLLEKALAIPAERMVYPDSSNVMTVFIGFKRTQFTDEFISSILNLTLIYPTQKSHGPIRRLCECIMRLRQEG